MGISELCGVLNWVVPPDKFDVNPNEQGGVLIKD